MVNPSNNEHATGKPQMFKVQSACGALNNELDQSALSVAVQLGIMKRIKNDR
jgi:hypothetical protein